ncbi:hypothetical protein LCGC14_2724370 [marine sediment metagenome]|uniref:Metal-sensitive transcriptional regulator n=1 Tax=marine sediment metagenome TaxID=412755 RepID=A0A0F8ZWL6_9ZZZZ
MRAETKKDALKRMSYIEGHFQGIRRMVEKEEYCVDILKQTYAVRRAIEKLEGKILDNHLHTCAIDGIRDGVRHLITIERHRSPFRSASAASSARGRALLAG